MFKSADRRTASASGCPEGQKCISHIVGVNAVPCRSFFDKAACFSDMRQRYLIWFRIDPHFQKRHHRPYGRFAVDRSPALKTAVRLLHICQHENTAFYRTCKLIITIGCICLLIFFLTQIIWCKCCQCHASDIGIRYISWQCPAAFDSVCIGDLQIQNVIQHFSKGICCFRMIRLVKFITAAVHGNDLPDRTVNALAIRKTEWIR